MSKRLQIISIGTIAGYLIALLFFVMGVITRRDCFILLVCFMVGGIWLFSTVEEVDA